MMETDTMGWMFFSCVERQSLIVAGDMTFVMVKGPGQASSWGDWRSNSGGLATLCLLLCTPAHSGDSSHSIASYCLLPAPGQPLPPLGHGLVVLRRCPQLLWLTSSWAPPISMGADQHQVQMGSGVAMWTLLLYANSTSRSQSAQSSCQ